LVEFYFYFRLLKMPTCICAVVGSSNNTYHLRNWKADFCKLHNCNFGTSICVCNPPFILFPFPTEKKDQEITQRWIKNIIITVTLQIQYMYSGMFTENTTRQCHFQSIVNHMLLQHWSGPLLFSSMFEIMESNCI